MYAEGHHHEWRTDSAHPTSEGMVAYESCHCGAHRVLCGTVPITQAGQAASSGVRTTQYRSVRRSAGSMSGDGSVT